MIYHFQDLLRRHTLWFIVFAWLFFEGTNMPAKRANRKLKSLPRRLPHRLRRSFDLPRPIWMRQARYRYTRCKGIPRAPNCLLMGVAREHFFVYLTQESGIKERCLLHVLHLLEEDVPYKKV